MNYAVRAVIIIGVAAAVSFFVAQMVIPEKGGAVQEASVPAEPAADRASAPVSESPRPDPAVVTTPSPSLPASPAPAPTSTSKTTTLTTATPQAPLPPPAPSAAEVAPPQRRARPSAIKVEKSAVCTAIEDRTPKGTAEKFSRDQKALYYFTHITGVRDTSAIMHRWYREGKLIQTSVLEVRSPNWRTHSKRNLTNIAEAAGSWRVEVVEAKTGNVLESASFVIE